MKSKTMKKWDYDAEAQINNNNNYHTATVNNNNNNNIINNSQDNGPYGFDGPVDFERAITLTGKGKFNHLLLLALVPVCWANTYSGSSISFVLPSAECDLKLTMVEQGILNSMSYTGMIITSFVWGFVVDAIGRRNIMVYGFLTTALSSLASSFSQSSWQLILFKLTDGIVISGPYAALQSYLAEIHSEKVRAEVYLWMGILFALGHISLSCLAWLVIPHEWKWASSAFLGSDIEFKSWRLFLALCSLPGFAAGFALCFFPESPRFLMAKRRQSDALDVFKKIYAMNTGKEPDTYPVKCLEEEESVEASGVNFKEILIGSFKQIQPLFVPPSVIALILTSFIQFGATIGSNTLRLWMPMLFSMIEQYDQTHPGMEAASLCTKIGGRNSNSTGTLEQVNNDCTAVVNAKVYTNSIIISIAVVIGYVIAKMLVNWVGKRVLMVSCFLGATFAMIALYWANGSDGILAISSIFVALSSIGGTIVNNVVVDLFPTMLRTMALSLTMAIGRVGAVVGNVLFPILFKLDCLGPFIMIGSVCMLCAVLTIVLPRHKYTASS